MKVIHLMHPYYKADPICRFLWDPKLTNRWKRVTCKKCLKLRGRK